MAVGPQLIGIQPNEGSLIQNGQVMHVSPRELVFRFDDGSPIDATTLSGIKISRSGGDGIFDRAYLSTDLGTSGAVVLDFSAATPGLSGNGIELRFTKVSRTDTSTPIISVSGSRVNIEVNTANGFKTSAQDLLRALDASTPAKALITAVRLRGSEFTSIADTVTAGQVLTLTGANSAKVSTNFGSSTNLQVEFVARDSGADGRNISLVFSSRDMGGQAAPVVTVSGTTINVVVNSNALFASTATDVVNAVNNSSTASKLVAARFVSGVGSTRIGLLPTSAYSPLRLVGATDVPVVPAYVGLGDTSREVIFRFAEELPDDIYQVDILGRGVSPLKNVDGAPFNGGVDRGIGFELDLGAKIASVVPQPIVRNEATDTLEQRRNEIYVYFNDDDLDVASAQDPKFYQLRYTYGTADSNDDQVEIPRRVVYEAALDRAILTFNFNLDEYVDKNRNPLPIGALRLRIGTNEEKLPAPTTVNAVADPGSRFDTARDISLDFNPATNQPKAVVISSEIKNTTPYLLDFPGANDEPGNRSTRYSDHVNTVDADGIQVIEYNFQGDLGRTAGSIQLNAITEVQKGMVRQIMSLYENYLGVRFVETAARGMTIAVGDMQAVVGGTLNGRDGLKLAAGPLVSNGQAAVVIDIQDFNAATDNEFGTDLFRSFMQGVGLLLGLGTAEELPNLTVMSNQPIVNPGIDTEMTFPGNQDIIHGQFVLRPEGKDVDLYRFSLPTAGELKIETFSERLQDSSLLNTALKLYQLQLDGSFKEIASNDDYYSEDSQIRVNLPAGSYVVGVSAKGNETYNPSIEDSGLGGRSEGRYDLRLDFRPPEASFMVDDSSDGDGSAVRIDGDSDGRPGGAYDFWFVPTGPTNTLFVDKGSKAGTANGALATPYKNIKDALAAATAGKVIRIVGNGGADDNLATTADNLAYEIGFNRFGQALADGSTFDVPRDVTVMVDAGAILKLNRARISIGSSSVSVDRSGSVFQSLGIPRIIDVATNKVVTDLAGAPIPGSVYFTSLNDLTIGKGVNPDRTPPAPTPGDWGGIDFRNQIDGNDESRKDLERFGLFLNSVVHSDIRYGGGQVVVDGVSQVITPIHMLDSRPSIANNNISKSADAAMAATPNSFKESNFQDSRTQAATKFIADFERVGPDIHGNHLTDNSINGLFVKVRTGAASALETMTVAGRFDDLDIVHTISENVVVSGSNGGPIQDSFVPPTTIVTLAAKTGGTLAAGNYNYKLVYVDTSGNESPASAATANVTVGANGAVDLANLPAVRSGIPFVSRRLYRSEVGGAGPYKLVAQLNAVVTNFADNGSSSGTPLVETAGRLRPRLNGSLTIDPGIIVKLQGARIEVQAGGQLIAEGTQSFPIVMTSADDRRYGAGGTFDTFKRTLLRAPAAGDWGGIYVGPMGSLALDHGVVAYAGGTTRIEGGFATFNPIELHQADARIVHSKFEFNSNGVEGSTKTNRAGRGTNFESTIFVRGSQPVIVENDIVGGSGAAINIDANSLNYQYVSDPGRSTGLKDATTAAADNQGPLIERNRLARNGINGMIVRGQTINTESVWDDADIVHVVFDEVTSSNFHAFGGLRLESKPSQSLVVKFESRGGANAGLNATGLALDFTSRIGGSIQIVGQPGYPAILTALTDDTVGAGFTPEGLPNVDTDGNSSTGGIQLLPTGPEQNNGTLIDNDVAAGIPGQFAFRAGAGGQSGTFTNDGVGGGISAQGINQLITNTDAIFEFLNYIDVGGDGTAVNLANTTITQPPVLVSDDLVASAGTFTGNGGNVVRWRIESRMDDGIAKVINTLTLDSDAPLGNIRFINYLDEDILGNSDDLMYLTGTPGQPNFRVFTLDGPERVGFSQGGIYADGSGLVNATYDGWAADQYDDLQVAIETGGTAYSVAGTIDTVDLTPFNDPTLGQVYGLNDITTAFAWSVVPTATTATITTFLELIAQNPATTAVAGDWNGVTLQTYSNDRNVGAVSERELTGTDSIGTNDIPNSSQFLGQIARTVTSGDENARLGFEIRGAIAKPSDVDVYSFVATGGTEVWLDIDKTNNALDTVVELIDANGRILALSNDSGSEETLGQIAFENSDLATNSSHPLRKTTAELYPSDSRGAPRDLYSTNPKDAGFRVKLPGQPTEDTLYHIRVRSSSILPSEAPGKLLDATQVRAGLSSGNYQLQVRLTEADEIPGSAISYADVRFASNGLTLAGVPRHSPLVGEAGEISGVANDTFATAQDLGNILQTDRQAISVAGDLSSDTDVDWFSFTIDYQLLLTPLRQYLSTIFDIDSADGIGRANTSMYLFDSTGRLISLGTNSNILDDIAGPLKGADNTDLSRGSAGTLDAYMGATELRAGRYFLAVTSNGRIPVALDQFTNPNSANPLVRLQPATSTQLLVEDHVDSVGGSSATNPIFTDFLNPGSSPVAWTLENMALYVSQDAGDDITTVFIVNPFTGQVANNVGTINNDVRDIAFRSNGGLRGFATPFDFDNVNNIDLDPRSFYYDINTGTAAVAVRGDTAAETNDNGGIGIEALAIGQFDGVESGFFVANRRNRALGGDRYNDNILYQFDARGDTGNAFSSPFADRQLVNNFPPNIAAGTDKVERGQWVTSAAEGASSTTSNRVVVTEATEVTSTATRRLIQDGDRFVVQSFPITVFEMNSGPELILNYDQLAGRTARDGDRFVLDGQTYEFDTGGVIVISPTVGLGLADGATVTITDGTLAGVSRTFEFDRAGGLSNPNNVRVAFLPTSTQAEMMTALATAINNAGFGVTASFAPGSNRLNVAGKSLTVPMVATGSGLSIDGTLGVSVGARRIAYSEAMTRTQFIDAIRGVMPPDVTIGVDGNRINFSGATTGTFTSLVNRGIATDTGADGNVSGGAVAVNFLAQDDAQAIAKRIEIAINNSGLLNGAGLSISALASARDVVVTNGAITNVVSGNRGLRRGDIAPGGLIKGTAFVNGSLFGVSDAGGLYRLDRPDNSFGLPGGQITGSYVTQSSDLLGIQFTGLAAGPTGVEGGRFSNLLFGTDLQGRIWAFDTRGRLQPVFANGATNVSTGVFGLNGISFSTLNQNLWQVTNNRAAMAGHGQPALPDGSRGASNGGSSWYFGDLNAPGGSAGVLESRPISLKGISDADEPTMYFNYLLNTSGINSTGQNLMQDAFRVYVGGDDGVWSLLTTNNSAEGSLAETFDVTQITGATTWRQARVDLSAFAGRENLRFRFEFSTAGSMGWGRSGGRGPEIRTIKASGLDDAGTLSIGGQTFELELGTSLTFPSGAAIKNGDTISVEGLNYVFFDGVGVPPAGTLIPFDKNQTAEQVAQAFHNAVSGATFPVVPVNGFSFSTEAAINNDSISTATGTPVDGSNMSLNGSGVIGDNLGLASALDSDVDMVRISLSRGATIAISAGSGSLDTYLRVFDSQGRELFSNDNFGGTTNSQITFTAADDGIYYVGVSASGNTNYLSTVYGTGIAGGTAGTYQLSIEVQRLFNPLIVGAKVQIEGAGNVTVSPGSTIVRQGDLGATGIGVPLQITDTAADVARKLRRKIADTFSNGLLTSYTLREEFVGLTGLTVANAGPFGLTTTKAEDNFSEYSIANGLNRPALRAQNNNFEGLYLDDIIIGTAERGEVALDTSAIGNGVDQTLFVSSGQGGIQVGPYQLEIRGGEESGQVTTSAITSVRTFGINERLTSGTNIRLLPGQEIPDGTTFTITDGVTITFEMDDVLASNGVTPGNVRIAYSSSTLDPLTNRLRPTTAFEIAALIRDAINSPTVQSVINVTASMINGDLVGATSDTLAIFGSATVSIPATLGTITFVEQSGDQNVKRDQGQVIVENSRFANSSGFGIRLQPDVRDANGSPNPGSVRNSIVLNTQRIVPGAVVYNNELMFNQAGGISIAGQTSAANQDPGSIPFARIYNNTIVGGSLRQDAPAEGRVLDNLLFQLGNQAFVDSVVAYSPNFGGGPTPVPALQTPTQALGVPNYTSNSEPVGGDGVVSLGNGGQLTIRFNDNYLRSSGDSKPDLYVREVGDAEDVFVEVSTDGQVYKAVGKIGGSITTIDLDAFGIVTSDRITFVRLTDDIDQGATTGDSVGADIDAVGALTSSLREIYTAGGVGIQVGENASPTLMNNAIINSITGISVPASSASTVVGGNLFQRNVANIAGQGASVGQSAIISSSNQSLFIDPANGLFYPSPSSQLIDSSIDSLEDRAALRAVKEPLGLDLSPILAPRTDISGLLRVDDPTVETPSGQGQSVFKDRGASDRADFNGPTVFIQNPIDNDTRGADQNSEDGVVELIGASASYFDLKLIDSTRNGGVSEGSGLNDRTVTSSAFMVYRNNSPLVDGVDYRFAYDSTSGTVRLTPISGVWPGGSVYSIRVLNTSESAIVLRDPNSYSDGTKFTVIGKDGAQTIFELDLGYQIQIPSTVTGINTIPEGSRFTLDDGFRRVVFEYDSNSLVTVGNVAITYSATDTALSVAEKTVAAIRSQQLTLSASTLDNGRIQIRGGRLVQFINTSGNLIVSGKPGTAPAFGLQIPTNAGLPTGVVDGQRFTVRLGNGISSTFEFDSNGVVAGGSKPISFTSTTTTSQLADSIVNALVKAGMGLSPSNTGGGFVDIGGDADVRIINNTSVLSIVGTPGAVASRSIGVDLTAVTSDVGLASLVASAINNAALPDVIVTQFGAKLLIEGVQGVAGDGANPVSAVEDVIGNPVRANQISGETIVVIQLGDGLDFGDAPDPTYPTRNTSNGARHKVEKGFSLGSTVSVDGDSRLNDGDIDDGVTFNNTLFASFATTIQVDVQGVSPSKPGHLVYWIDFDKDGLFENTNERFTTIAPITAPGLVNVPVRVPSTAAGETWARFRLSSNAASIQNPTGEAPDGEVEDYKIVISANPYSNPSNRLDVTADGRVSPVDSLVVINFLNLLGKPSQVLTVPVPPGTNLPPYYDVNGDGLISSLDALNVINFLNARGNGEGEASSTFDSSTWVAATSTKPEGQAAPVAPASNQASSSTGGNSGELARYLELPNRFYGPVETPSVLENPEVVAVESILDEIAGTDSNQSVLDAAFQDNFWE